MRVTSPSATDMLFMYTLKEDKLLVSPKDKNTLATKSSVIYWFKCNKVECENEYKKESSRTLGERYKEHLMAPSPIY